MIPTFTVIDNETGKEVDKRLLSVIDEYGLEISLKHSTFIITEDGRLCFVDMWRQIYECSEDRFRVIFDEGVKQ